MYALRHQFSHLLSQTFYHCSTCLTPAVSLTLTLLIPCEYQPIHLYCSSAMSHQHTQCTRKCSQTPTPGAYRPLQGAACSHTEVEEDREDLALLEEICVGGVGKDVELVWSPIHIFCILQLSEEGNSRSQWHSWCYAAHPLAQSFAKSPSTSSLASHRA